MEEITYEEIEKEIEDLYKKIEYLYGKANTKSKQRRLFSTICALDKICSEDCLDLNIVSSHLIKKLYMESKFFDYYDDVNYNLEILKELSLVVINTFKDINYPFYKNYKSRDYVPDSDKNNLIYTYFNSFNDQIIDKFIKKAGDNYYLEFSSDLAFEGALYNLPIFKKYIIHLNTANDQNLFYVISAIHEMGHAYEKEIFYGNGEVNLLDMYKETFFYEVSSSFFEYTFINFLNENNYYPKEIKYEYNLFYLELLKNAFKTYSICLNGIDEVNNSYYIKLDNKDKMEEVEKLKEALNYYEKLPNYNDKLSILDSVIYFVGGLLAINLYNKYKDNPKEFMKKFRTFLVNYPRSGVFDSLEVVGITKEELLSSKVLKKELNKFINSSYIKR